MTVILRNENIGNKSMLMFGSTVHEAANSEDEFHKYAQILTNCCTHPRSQFAFISSNMLLL